MAYIQKANVILEVKDAEVEYYLNLGYNEITEDGKIIKESTPNDIHTLQKSYEESKAKIKQLTAKVEELEAELAKVKTKKETTVETESKPRGRKAANKE